MRRIPELARAALFYAGFLLLFFQASWRTSGIASPDLFVRMDPAKHEWVHGGEDLRQFFSWFRFASENLRRGVFPSWTPYAGGGQPFVGKQQNALFYPLNALIYLWNAPSVFLLELALRLFLAAIFTFLLSRKLGLDFAPSLAAGAVYMISNCMTHWGIHAYSASAAFVPCVLLLTEHYLDGFSRRALTLLPFAVALSFLGGHSESAIRGYLLAGLYLCARLPLMRKIPASRRWSALASYVGFASLGGLLSMAHLLPSAEYYLHSYTQVWRNLEEFAFSQHHVSRALRLDDAPLLIAGAAGLALFGWCLRKLAGSIEARRPSAIGFAAIGAGGLALFLSSYASLGMTMEFWPHMTLQLKYDATQAAWVGPLGCAFGFFSLTFLALALLDRESPVPFKIFGAVFLAGLALIHRTPLISHVVYSLPLLKQFLPELSPETDLCMALTAAYGFHRLLSQSTFSRRFALALLAPVLWIVLIAGYWASFPLKSPLVDWLGIGQNAANARRNPDPFVSILDGGQLMERAPTQYDIRIRVDRQAGEVQRVFAGLAESQLKLGPVEARPLSIGPQYSYYKGKVDVPFDFQGQYLLDLFPFAVVETSTGRRQAVGASEILISSPPSSPEYWYLPILLALAVCGVILAGPRATTLLLFALMACWCYARGNAYYKPQVPARAELLPKIPAIEAIRADTELSRIFSFDEHFLGPELLGNYGVSDFRTWDALDVLEHIYYLRLLQGLAASGRPDLAKKLLDIANVKYVLAHVNDPPPAPGLTPITKERLEVFSNPGALPRVGFYTDTQSVDYNEFKDWRTATQRGLPLVGSLLPSLDPRRTLLLTDRPGLQTRSPQEKPTGGTAEVKEYRLDDVKVQVHAPQTGYLFLSDTYFPGWKALLDGKETSILRAWINFRAVPVPPGEHVVEFVYRPLSLLVGAIGTVLTLFITLWLWRREYAFDPGLATVEALVLGNICIGAAYWGIWCLLIDRGAGWDVRLCGAALLASLGFPLSLVRKKALTPGFFKAFAMPKLQHQERP